MDNKNKDQPDPKRHPKKEPRQQLYTDNEPNDDVCCVLVSEHKL